MLEREFQYYKDHKAELLKKHLGKFIVIANDEVIGSYPNQEKALCETVKTHPLGTFLIQQIVADDSASVQRFTSRVYVHARA